MLDMPIIAKRVTVLQDGYWSANSERNVVFKLPAHYTVEDCREEVKRRGLFNPLALIEIKPEHEVRRATKVEARYFQGDNS